MTQVIDRIDRADWEIQLDDAEIELDDCKSRIEEIEDKVATLKDDPDSIDDEIDDALEELNLAKDDFAIADERFGSLRAMYSDGGVEPAVTSEPEPEPEPEPELEPVVAKSDAELALERLTEKMEYDKKKEKALRASIQQDAKLDNARAKIDELHDDLKGWSITLDDQSRYKVMYLGSHHIATFTGGNREWVIDYMVSTLKVELATVNELLQAIEAIGPPAPVQTKKSGGKRGRKPTAETAKAAARAKELKADGHTNSQIRDIMEEEGMKYSTPGVWHLLQRA